MATHRINRVEFELEVAAVELGRHVSERVSFLHGQRIPSLLDRVCSEVDDAEPLDESHYAGLEPLQRIDKLELELGSIALSHFDDELLAKLEAALRLALRGRTQRPPQLGPPIDDKPPPDASTTSDVPKQSNESHYAGLELGRGDHAIELLDVYAWTGNLPWWADIREHHLVAGQIREVLVHAPTRWLELLREHADDRVGLDRLARACNGELFATMLERAGAGAAQPDLHTLEQLLALVGVRSERVRATLLASLGRHGRIDPSTILLSVLRDMDVDVLAVLVEQLDAQPQLFTAPVRAAIASASAGRVTRGQLEDAARDPLEGFDEHDADATESESEQAGSEQTESEQAEEPIEPAERATFDRNRSDPAATTRERAAITLDPEHARQPEPTPDARRSTPPPAIHRNDRQLQLARRRALAHLDELYIEDAGLVILWPFIERLFTRVELLDERRFRDEAAQTRAIALLAHLALGDPAVPEQQLAFAKLLCGRAPEQACELDAPLDAELCEESERMLAAVIDHAPILDGMPVPRFRTTFLQRSGALTVRSGSWLLTVDRQPYDLVLQRFSWSWAWVKFPWMPDPLTVEW